MTDTRTFKKGEVVIVHDGNRKRTSIELAEVGQDCSYINQEVLITYGSFNSTVSKSGVHKIPTTLRRKINEQPNV